MVCQRAFPDKRPSASPGWWRSGQRARVGSSVLVATHQACLRGRDMRAVPSLRAESFVSALEPGGAPGA